MGNECSSKCRCSAECCLRVVQRGVVSPSIQLELFYTGDESTGWGLRTLTEIEKGTYCCEYVGEYITEQLAEHRGKKYDKGGSSYLWTQEHSEKECAENLDAFTIDAAHFGHVARYINHSCDPNLKAASVLAEIKDFRYPRIGMFAMKKIRKYSELTVHYGYKKFPFSCKCGTLICHAQ
mmetsp:Transcript_12661/g.24343  ORF Transcript_12661/g.24343 Transcript_12661/m.24343 type:complete len:179 (+) Transcript_12661:656-1192(+)